MAVLCLSCRCSGRAPQRRQGDGGFGRIDPALLRQGKARSVLGVTTAAGCAIDAILLDDFDDKANHLGIKGVGELGICGTGAAVANAVFNATGIRVRDFPITMDKLLPELPEFTGY